MTNGKDILNIWNILVKNAECLFMLGSLMGVEILYEKGSVK